MLAGQTALDAHGRIVGADVVEQFEQALTNLLDGAARRPAGGPDQLAGLTIYSVDLADYRAHAREIGQVWRRLVGTDYPASAGIGISRLWDDEALVELQGIAILLARSAAAPSRRTPRRGAGAPPAPGAACRPSKSWPARAPGHRLGSTSSGSPGSRKGSRRHAVSAVT